MKALGVSTRFALSGAYTSLFLADCFERLRLTIMGPFVYSHEQYLNEF